MNRRHLLATVPLLALTGCPGTTSTQLTTDIQTVAAALATLPALLAQAKIAVPTAVTQAIATLNSDAASIASVATSGTTVSAVISDIQTVAGLVTPFFQAAGAIVPIVDAALSIISTIASEAGIVTASATLSAAPMMSPAKARAYLKAAATP